MPELDSPIHVRMLENYRRKNTLFRRVARMFKGEFLAPPIYGLEWGDPDDVEGPLAFVRERYLMPYVKGDQTAVEIGPGGGRWTRYFLPFRKLYVVDYHQELLDELKRNFNRPNMTFIKNNGTDFPGVPPKSVDFIYSFGCFVHLDVDLIAGYLKNIREIAKPDANIVLQYSDKTKVMARENPGFSDNTPDRMRELVKRHGYEILEEDLSTLWHSAVIRLRAG